MGGYGVGIGHCMPGGGSVVTTNPSPRGSSLCSYILAHAYTPITLFPLRLFPSTTEGNRRRGTVERVTEGME